MCDFGKQSKFSFIDIFYGTCMNVCVILNIQQISIWFNINFVSLSTLPTYYSAFLSKVILYFKNINEGLVLKLYIKAKVLVCISHYTELAHGMVLGSLVLFYFYSWNILICLDRRTCKIQNQWLKIIINSFWLCNFFMHFSKDNISLTKY